MWAGDTSSYQGKHYQLAEPINNPPPLTKPHPPILIGGGGEKKTLRLVAQYADACNVFAMGDAMAEVPHKFDVLKRHCDDVGRPYEEIERTALGMVMLGEGGMSSSDLIETCRKLAGMGVQQFIFSMPNVHDISPLETIGREVIPAVAEF
jgi:alkanesulfonate monooxygenase